ncbi:hypothetical protein AJ78_04663 [Emergomyces pasteurianus Ep9510]|uniref:FHA domain-containing protein n=1 Tax=Emergomyces pasteurianus Ep9510 TaxID=1447872 RepID=A0A1J9PEU8_9EURO|nr:hypothetical protein AJ78_04663 [Emergomyces pasteurianus Ep9510]
MSTSSPSATTTTVPSSESSTSRPSRLRRLSSLRAYTHSHLSGNSSSGHRLYRNSLTRVVGLSLHSATSSASFPTTDAAPTTGNIPATATATTSASSASHTQPIPARLPCPETDTSRLSTNLSAQSESSSSSDLHSPAPSSSASSHSTPSDGPESSESQLPSDMVRYRNMAGIDVLGAHQDTPQNLEPTPTTAQDRSESSVEHSADTTQNTTPGNMESPRNREEATSQSSQDPCSKSDPPKPTIRFYAYQDPNHNSRPSLPFTTTSRTLPGESSVIRVGRYSERDGIPVHNPTEPSDAPIGFKSKVVSRRHCEFSFVSGQWHIRDVGSSSGTFLNHMRLSQPNMASRLYAVRDGDILQLGIDFRGGEEMIFRCVRMRIECNRTWQQKANEFNKNTAALINNLGKGNNAADHAGSRECSICLGSVLRPYQCLFMAACAHVWHYKCIRRLIHSPEYPMFQCPNCRAYTDLSAEVDDSNDPFDDEAHGEPPNSRDQPVQDYPNMTMTPNARNSTERTVSSSNGNGPTAADNGRLAGAVDRMNLEETPLAAPLAVAGATDGLNDSSHVNTDTNANAVTTNGLREAAHGLGEMISRSPNIDIPPSLRASGSRRLQPPWDGGDDVFEDTPLTPRNDFGPLAFDGRAGRL